MNKEDVRRSTERRDVSYEHHRSSINKSEIQRESNSQSNMQKNRNNFDEKGSLKILLEVKPGDPNSNQT